MTNIDKMTNIAAPVSIEIAFPNCKHAMFTTGVN